MADVSENRSVRGRVCKAEQLAVKSSSNTHFEALHLFPVPAATLNSSMWTVRECGVL